MASSANKRQPEPLVLGDIIVPRDKVPLSKVKADEEEGTSQQQQQQQQSSSDNLRRISTMTPTTVSASAVASSTQQQQQQLGSSSSEASAPMSLADLRRQVREHISHTQQQQQQQQHGTSVSMSATPIRQGARATAGGVTPPSSSSTMQDNNNNNNNNSGIISAAGKKAAYERARNHWHSAMDKVKMANAMGGQNTMFPIERLHELRSSFVDAAGQLVELDEDEFYDAFSTMLAGRRFTEREIRQWFRDIDVDCSENVSWEEFTNFMINQASTSAQDNHRSREFLEMPRNNVAYTEQHHDLPSVVGIHSNAHPGICVTGAYDGVVKVWDVHSGTRCLQTINNTINSAAHETPLPGTTVPSSAVSDVVFNARGNSLYVAALDKTINVYDTTSSAAEWPLTRSYVGRMINTNWYEQKRKVAMESPPTEARKLLSNLIEPVFLAEMNDAPTSVDAATQHDKEIFYVGQRSGSILAYPTTRHVPQLSPIETYTPHCEPVSKVRYLQQLNSLVSCSWDRTLALTDPSTGKAYHLRGGSERGMEGHQKSVVDFAFHGPMRILASIGIERQVLLWNPNMDTPLASLAGHSGLLHSVAFDEADGLLMTLDDQSVVRIWDLRTYAIVQSVSLKCNTQESAPAVVQRLSTMTYVPSESSVVAVGAKPYSWRIRRSLSHFPASHVGHIDPIAAVAVVPSTQTLLTSDMNSFMTWDLKSGKRLSVVDANENNAALDSICALCVDSNERRLILAKAAGSAVVYNYRNSQLLRDAKSHTPTEPNKVVHLSSLDGVSRVICVMTANQISIVDDIDADSEAACLSSSHVSQVLHPRTKKSHFTCAVSFPSKVKTTLASLVVGTTDSLIMTYTTSNGAITGCMAHPRRPRTRHHHRKMSREQNNSRGSVVSRGSAGTGPHGELDVERMLLQSSQSADHRRGSSPNNSNNIDNSSSCRSPDDGKKPRKLAVEDIAYVPQLDLFVSCLGDNTLYFWDLHHTELKLMFVSDLKPEECILCLAATDNKDIMAASLQLHKAKTIAQQEDHRRLRGTATSTTSEPGKKELKGETAGGSFSGTTTTSAAPPLPSTFSSHYASATIKLISSDDLGFVYVRDISNLPHSRENYAAIPDLASRVVLTNVFRAHNSTIHRLAYVAEFDQIVTAGEDGYVKTFLSTGDYIGYFGQSQQWNIRKLRSFHQCDCANVFEDKIVMPQRPASAAVGTPSTPFAPPPRQQEEVPATPTAVARDRQQSVTTPLERPPPTPLRQKKQTTFSLPSTAQEEGTPDAATGHRQKPAAATASDFFMTETSFTSLPIEAKRDVFPTQQQQQPTTHSNTQHQQDQQQRQQHVSQRPSATDEQQQHPDGDDETRGAKVITTELSSSDFKRRSFLKRHSTIGTEQSMDVSQQQTQQQQQQEKQKQKKKEQVKLLQEEEALPQPDLIRSLQQQGISFIGASSSSKQQQQQQQQHIHKARHSSNVGDVFDAHLKRASAVGFTLETVKEKEGKVAQKMVPNADARLNERRSTTSSAVLHASPIEHIAATLAVTTGSSSLLEHKDGARSAPPHKKRDEDDGDSAEEEEAAAGSANANASYAGTSTRSLSVKLRKMPRQIGGVRHVATVNDAFEEYTHGSALRMLLPLGGNSDSSRKQQRRAHSSFATTASGAHAKEQQQRHTRRGHEKGGALAPHSHSQPPQAVSASASAARAQSQRTLAPLQQQQHRLHYQSSSPVAVLHTIKQQQDQYSTGWLDKRPPGGLFGKMDLTASPRKPDGTGGDQSSIHAGDQQQQQQQGPAGNKALDAIIRESQERQKSKHVLVGEQDWVARASSALDVNPIPKLKNPASQLPKPRFTLDSLYY